MAKDKTGLGGCLATLIVFGTTAGMIAIIAGYTTALHLDNYYVRALFCAGFLFWGVAYIGLKESKGLFAVGLVQIVASVCSNWYQLARLAEGGAQEHLYDRLVLIGVGIAGLSSGWKDLIEGLDKLDKTKKATPLSNES